MVEFGVNINWNIVKIKISFAVGVEKFCITLAESSKTNNALHVFNILLGLDIAL